jgi:hypothetical protein
VRQLEAEGAQGGGWRVEAAQRAGEREGRGLAGVVRSGGGRWGGEEEGAAGRRRRREGAVQEEVGEVVVEVGAVGVGVRGEVGGWVLLLLGRYGCW